MPIKHLTRQCVEVTHLIDDKYYTTDTYDSDGQLEISGVVDGSGRGIADERVEREMLAASPGCPSLPEQEHIVAKEGIKVNYAVCVAFGETYFALVYYDSDDKFHSIEVHNWDEASTDMAEGPQKEEIIAAVPKVFDTDWITYEEEGVEDDDDDWEDE